MQGDTSKYEGNRQQSQGEERNNARGGENKNDIGNSRNAVPG
jgi:hypothetical protein